MPKKKKHFGKRKKSKKAKAPPPPIEEKKVEQSFIFKRGRIGKALQSLLEDTRRVMQPNTALHLHERKSNTLKDFLHVAGPLGVTHFLIFSATDFGSYLRIARVPNGPTLTFSITAYSLMRDIAALQQKPHSPASEFKHSPLVVLNNFKGAEESVKLMAVIFQKMFPPINVKKMRVEDCKRVVVFDYDAETNLVQLRHYLITSHPIGVSKSVKRLLQKQLPDLSQLQDISQYVLRNAKASESDLEDGDETHVEVERQFKIKQRIKQHYVTNVKTKVQQSAVRLQELGPRLTLSLVKVQEGFCDGQVLYHQFVTKTPEEEERLEERKLREREVKEERRRQQLLNLAKKGKLPAGVEVPTVKDAEIKEEGDPEEEGADPNELLDNADEEAESSDYGDEGDEDAEIETLRKNEKGKQKQKQKPSQNGHDEDAEIETPTKNKKRNETQKPNRKRKASESRKEQTDGKQQHTKKNDRGGNKKATISVRMPASKRPKRK